MTYKTDDYYKLDRAHARAQTLLSCIDRARLFNSLRYVDSIKITGQDRDGRTIEVSASGDLMKAILAKGANLCIENAAAIASEQAEVIDFEKAAQV